MEQPRAAIVGRGAADAEEDPASVADMVESVREELAHAARARMPRVAFIGGDVHEPRGARHLNNGGARSGARGESELGPHGATEGVGNAHRMEGGLERGREGLGEALTTVGNRNDSAFGVRDHGTHPARDRLGGVPCAHRLLK